MNHLKTENSPEKLKQKRTYLSPLRLVIAMALSIFLVELLSTQVIVTFKISSLLFHPLIDSLFLTILLSPALYFFMYRPLVQHITQRENAFQDLKRIEWLLSKSAKPTSEEFEESPELSHADLTELNTSGVIKKMIGKDLLAQIAGDYLDLLDSSGAIYEKNGQYALGILTSGWCQFLVNASRKLCETKDNAEALNSGKWLCHESCWHDAAKPCIEKGESVDIECNGGIRIYTVPVIAGSEIVGSMNLGYGNPPHDPQKLQEIAEKYQLDVDELTQLAKRYESRPPYIIEIAKNRLSTSARLIGEIIERKWAEEELSRSEYELRVMNQISEVFLTVSDDEMYPEVLKIVLEAMDSKYGLFGYINEDDGSIVYPSLTREVFGQCKISNKAIVFPRETWGGLWGQSLIEKKILYSNKPYKIPDGHIPITRSISTPIVYQDKLIGHIHVANKATDYGKTDRILIDKIAKNIAPVLYARLQKERQEKKRELAEGKLRDSEQRYRAFMQNFQGIAFQGDMNFIPTFFHGTVEAITGYSEKEFTAGSPRWDQVIHPDDLPAITSDALEKISSIPNYSDEREYRIIRKDGKICWVQEIIQNICDDSGKPSAVQGVIYDITEHKLIEEEIKKHRQHLEDLVKERTTKLSKANKELEREIREHKQAEEKLYRKHQIQVALKDILSISIKPCGLEKMLDLILGRIVSIDWLTLESKSCIFLSDGDSNELVLKSYRDFSDILINSCSRIPFSKCVCGKAAATKEIQFISSDDSDHEIQPDDISPHSHYCVPILSFDKVLGVLNLYVKKDHQRNQEEDVFFRSVANVLAGIIKRKQAEEDLKDRQQEIEEINATLENRVQEELEKSRQKDYVMIQKSRLAAMGEMMQYIIHQWGQPLNALNILFYNLELLLEDSDLGIKEKEVDKFIANGLKLVKEMFSTVDDFRNFFKTRKEKVKFSVNKNIKDSLSLFGDSLAHSKIAVTLNETEELTILGFPNEFFQVILNILKNAKDAIIANGVNGEINISLLSEDDSAIVRIEDNGGGIPEDIIGKVFDSYFSTKTEEKGTGIGLYMSKVIIEEHMKGHITAKNINGGAELEIILPISEHNKNLSKFKPLLKESSPIPEKTVS